jgi:hypothetical protein
VGSIDVFHLLFLPLKTNKIKGSYRIMIDKTPLPKEKLILSSPIYPSRPKTSELE